MRRNIPAAVAALLALVAAPVAAQEIFATPSITPVNITPGYFNLDQSLLPHWRNCVAKVRLGTARCKLMTAGDSTTSGAGAGTSGAVNLIGARVNSYPAVLAKILAGYVAINDNAILADQNVVAQGVTYPQYDPRVTMGANWANSGSGTALGGVLFHFTTGAANNMTFTPAAAFDTIVIYYVRNAGHGTFTTNVDGGASLGTTNAAGAAAVLTTTFSVTKATHTINIVPANDAQFFIVGVITQDSTASAIDLYQAGIYGATSTTFNSTTNAWSPLSLLPTIAPDLTIIDLTINDSNAGTALATYSANIQALITSAKLSGDVVLMVGPPSNTAAATNGTLDTYIGTLQNLSITNGAPLTNFKQRWVSYAAMNAIMPYFDSLHPAAPGYQDMAEALTNAIAPSDALGAATGTGLLVRAASPVLIGHPSFSGNKPVVSACGTSPTIDGKATDISGKVTVGATTATCTITFATAFATYNHCSVQSGTTLAAFAYTYSLSAIVVTATVLGGDLVDYKCDGD